MESLPAIDHHAHVLEAVEAAAAEEGFESWTRRLMPGCRLQAQFVDDGFRLAGALSLSEHMALAGGSVRRILRIETAAEGAAAAGGPLEEVMGRFRSLVEEAVASGAAGIKTIAAYRGGLELPPPEEPGVTEAWDRWRKSGSTRLADPVLVSLFVREALEVLRSGGWPLPLQVHTGFGDTDLALHRANPSLLGWLFEDPRYIGVPVVMLHCYPFVREASHLCSVYPNAHMDLSLAVTFAPHRATDLILEALDLARASYCSPPTPPAARSCSSSAPGGGAPA